MIEFSNGLKYPWGKPGRLWNILWLLVPIFGWFALYGYMIKIIQNLVSGKTTELPEMEPVVEMFTFGFIMFLKLLPLMIAVGIFEKLLTYVPYIGTAATIAIELLILPYLTINFFVKEKFEETWNFKKTFDVVFGNLKEYVIALIMSIGYFFIYGLASLVLVGIPCLAFGSQFFMANFYRTAK